MKKVGIIAQDDDLTHAAKQMAGLYGKEQIGILHTEKHKHGISCFDTVETLVENTDMIVLKGEAVKNQALLFHIIKKADKIFLDIDFALAPAIIEKCRKYQEEAGNEIAFNVSPYILLRKHVNQLVYEPAHMEMFIVQHCSQLSASLYPYLLYACMFLNCANIKSSFYIMPNTQNIMTMINLDIKNTDGKYFHLTAGNYEDEQKYWTAFNQNTYSQQSITEDNFFKHEDILKIQLDALYNNQSEGTLDEALIVSSLMEKMNYIIKRKGFS